MKNLAKIQISLGIALAVPFIASGATETFDLSTTGASGTLYLTNVNNETDEPNTPSGKTINYPYYFDPDQNLYVVIAAEPLAASNVYPFEQTNYTVLNNATTDPGAGDYTFGSLSWDDALLTGSGTEVLGISDFTLTFDGTPFSPMFGPNNINNEFFWDYEILGSNMAGPGLEFTDGALSSIDFTADIAVTPRLTGNPAAAFGSSYDGNVTFSGNQFLFNVDVIQDNTSFLGGLTDTHLFFDSTGLITGVVPEPGTYALIAGFTVLLGAILRRRAIK